MESLFYFNFENYLLTTSIYKKLDININYGFEIHADMKTCEVFAPALGAPLEVPWETIFSLILDGSV
jgi:hypothetical protein